MARGYMVPGVRYTPLSFDEITRPLVEYTNEYNAQEAAYGELDNNAAQWERLKYSPVDQNAYQRYKGYNDFIQQAAEDLSKEGLTPGSRRRVREASKRYREEILPIEQAYQKRAELSKLERETRAKDPTTLVERSADQISLDELIANPELTPRTYSGSYLERSAAQSAAALSKQVRTREGLDQLRKWYPTLGGQYWETRMKTGYSADEIYAAVMGDPTSPPELRAVVAQTIEPLRGWNNPEALQQGMSHVARGLWQAIGEDKYQNLQNPDYIDKLTRMKLAGSPENQGRTRLPVEQGGTTIIPTDPRFVDPMNFRSTNRHSKEYENNVARLEKLNSDRERILQEYPNAEKFLRWEQNQKQPEGKQTTGPEVSYGRYQRGLSAFASVGAGGPRNPYIKDLRGASELAATLNEIDNVTEQINKYNKNLQDYDDYLVNKYGSVEYGNALESALSKVVEPVIPVNFSESSEKNLIRSMSDKNVIQIKDSGKEKKVSSGTLDEIKKGFSTGDSQFIQTPNGLRIRYKGDTYDYTGGSEAFRGTSQAARKLTDFLFDWSVGRTREPERISGDFIAQSTSINGQPVKVFLNTRTGENIVISASDFIYNPSIYQDILEQVTASGAVDINREYQDIAKGPSTNDFQKAPGIYGSSRK